MVSGSTHDDNEKVAGTIYGDEQQLGGADRIVSEIDSKFMRFVLDS